MSVELATRTCMRAVNRSTMVSARRACRDGFAYIKPTRVCQKNNPPRKRAKIHQLTNTQINDNANVIQTMKRNTNRSTHERKPNERTNKCDVNGKSFLYFYEGRNFMSVHRNQVRPSPKKKFKEKVFRVRQWPSQGRPS